MPYGLKDIELEKLSKVFAANERIERVVLYGSRAKGNYKPFSDVDITLEGAELTHTDLNRISLAIDDLLLPYQFDISIFHTLKNEALIDHIRRMGITIYEKKSEWKEYKLGEIADVQTGPFGSQLHQSDYVDAGIPSIMPVNIGNRMDISTEKIVYITEKDAKRLSRYRVQIGDIVYSRRGDVEKCAYINEKENGWLCGTGCLRIRIDLSKADSKFIAYYLSTDDMKSWISNNAVGTTMPNLNSSILQQIPLSLPTLPTQRRIASILSSLDDKIDLLHRENATLEQMAETLFRQWFVVERKEEWEEGKLGDYVVETVGGEWGKENPEGDYTKAVQCIRGTDIADLNVGLATKTPIRFVKESKFEKIEPRNGDIIMEISGGTENQSTGRVTYVNKDVKVLFDYPIVFSNFCRLLRVKEEYTYFVYCYMKYLYEQDEFFNLENGSSGIKNLDYKALLYELTYPMPTHKQQILDFNDKVSVYFEKINRNKLQIQTLIQTRDGLLPKLMNNEINI